jgi:hypothetical protein
LLYVIASHQRELDAPHRVARTIILFFGGWLLADIGWLRNDRRGRRFGAGSDSSRGSRAGIDAGNWRLGRFRVLGLVLVVAILLAACLSFAVAVAVLLDA